MRGSRAPLVEEEDGPRRTVSGRAWVPIRQRRIASAAAPPSSQIDVVPDGVYAPTILLPPIVTAASEIEEISSPGSPSSLPNGRISVEDWRETITITANEIKDEFTDNIILDEEYSNEARPTKRSYYLNGELLPLEFVGLEMTIPKEFPQKQIGHGMMLPKVQVLQKLHIIVCGKTSEGISEEDLAAGSASVKECLAKQKAKKRNECHPDFNQRPAKLAADAEEGGDLYYRYIIMYREAKTPILFIGFDRSEEKLEDGFWVKALNLKSKVLNPKSAQPTQK